MCSLLDIRDIWERNNNRAEVYAAFLMVLFRQSFRDFELSAKFLVAIFHRGKDLGVFGFFVDADHFLGIFLEVEELPFFGAGEVEEFVFIGADTVVGGDVVGGFSGVIVVNGIAPVIGGFAFVFEDGDEASSLDVFGDFDAGGFEESRSVIDVLDERFGSDAGLHDSGPAHDERHGEGFFKHPTFVIPTFFTEEETLIG